MKKLINDPAKTVDEGVAGFAAAERVDKLDDVDELGRWVKSQER